MMSLHDDEFGIYMQTPPDCGLYEDWCDMESSSGSDAPQLTSIAPLETAKDEETCFNNESVSFYASKYDDDIDVESFSLRISGLDPSTVSDEIRNAVKADMESIDMSNIEDGYAFIDFYDIRCARAIRRNGLCLRGAPVIVRYGLSKKVAENGSQPNNGVLAVFYAPKNSTEKLLEAHFAKHGAVRSVRRAGNKAGQWYIEFYDRREADRARMATNRKQFMGLRIATAFSKPSHYRCEMERQYIAPIMNRINC